MADRNGGRRDLLESLLVERTTEGLEPAAEAALTDLLNEFPETDPMAFERAAAAIWLAATPPAEPMPQNLRDRILARIGTGAAGED